MKLSIAIPTYNRALILGDCIDQLIAAVQKYRIMLYVIDNASQDGTEQVVSEFRKKYPFIEYCRNQENLGPAGNIVKALEIPKSDYIWLIGDTYVISPSAVDEVMGLIQNNSKRYDAIVVNLMQRVQNVPTQDFEDCVALLSQLGWHMTCLACLIYRSDLIRENDFSRYMTSNYMQTAIIFETIASRSFLVHFSAQCDVGATQTKGLVTNGWQSQAIEIWTERWPNFVFSLPVSYPLKTKIKCVMDHSKYTRLFSFNNLVHLRLHGWLNWRIYKQFSKQFYLTMKLPRMIVFLISIFPRGVIKIFT